MPLANHIGPDHYLNLAKATSVSKEDVVAAWDKAYTELREKLTALGPEAVLYVVFGLQGSGKSTWINENAGNFGAKAIFLDGPLPSKRHRSRALSIAKEFACKCVAVWVDTSYDVAFVRNSRRPGLSRIKEEAILHVFQSLEPATLEEGFHEVLRIGSVAGEA